MLRQRRMVEYLTQGAQVIVHGRLTVYEARGELQVVVDFVQPEGVGLRHAQFERLRLQLEEEGLFDAGPQAAAAAFPQRIGVVTSPSRRRIPRHLQRAAAPLAPGRGRARADARAGPRRRPAASSPPSRRSTAEATST